MPKHKKHGPSAPCIIAVPAIIHDDEGRIFATQRGYGDYKDGWEFPGGKMEPGEMPEEALKREIWEELETKRVVESLVQIVEFDYPQFHLKMHCFWCRVDSGSLTLKEHEAARWLTNKIYQHKKPPKKHLLTVVCSRLQFCAFCYFC